MQCRIRSQAIDAQHRLLPLTSATAHHHASIGALIPLEPWNCMRLDVGRQPTSGDMSLLVDHAHVIFVRANNPFKHYKLQTTELSGTACATETHINEAERGRGLVTRPRSHATAITRLFKPMT
jgi:hypothetical protein